MMTKDNVSERELLVRVVVGHVSTRRGVCACGGYLASADPVDQARHVADAILAAGFGDVAQANDALEAADAERASLRVQIEVDSDVAFIQRQHIESLEAERDAAWETGYDFAVGLSR